MKINKEYLKDFIEFDYDTRGVSDLLETMGFEIEEIVNHKAGDVIDLEVTPNRPDWLSHYGIARDMYAKNPNLKLIKTNNITVLNEINNVDFKIKIEDEADCPRYSGCILKNIKVEESSQKIKDLLASLGLRPINSIVDISNIMLMAYGHPIHIFDLDRLEGNEINIRRAKTDEKIILLDGREVDLNPDFLVIADNSKPVALAGIMGGEDTGVTFDTKNIFIESAVFNPIVIRKSARKIGVSTDASFRFERGTDILCTKDIIEKTIDKIKEQDSGNSLEYFADIYPKKFIPKRVLMEKSFPKKYSGIDIDFAESESILNRLGFKTLDKGDSWEIEVPSYRVDIYGKQDFIEEIVRIYGYDNLESNLPEVMTNIIKKSDKRDFKRKIKDYLIGIGAYEAINYSFNKKEYNAFFGKEDSNIEIKNPLGTGFAIMRNSLIPGLFQNIATNLNQFQENVFLFEYGSVFFQNEGKINQKDQLVISASGIYRNSNWKINKNEEWDLFIFKSIIKGMFTKLFIDIVFEKKKIDYYERGTSFAIISNEREIGVLGMSNDKLNSYFDVKDDVFFAEIELEKLYELKHDFSMKAWNIFPTTKRDISFYVSRDIDYEKIKKTIDKIKPKFLNSFELFDLYEGKGNPKGMVSLSMSFTYQDDKGTLESNEVNEIHNKFAEELIDILKLIRR